ncbi:alpha/beta-hydrolase, partial [Pluteus cervinus]
MVLDFLWRLLQLSSSFFQWPYFTSCRMNTANPRGIPVPEPIEIVYKRVDDLDIAMDVYIPASATKDNPAPIVLWWHGGGLLQGTRKAPAPHSVYAPHNHNICLISVDYRLAPQTRLPGILSDCSDALSFIQQNPLFASLTNNRVDVTRIVLSGSSAGGWLSLLVGTGIGYKACGLPPPTLPQVATGICAIYPISDLEDSFWTTKQRPVSYMTRVVDRKEVEPFVNPQDVKTASSVVDGRRSIFYTYMIQEAILAHLLLDGTGIPAKSFSVAHALKTGNYPRSPPDLPPTYIIHGNADDKVPHRQATDVVEALQGISGAQVEYVEPDGLNHGFDREDGVDLEDMYTWIKEVLK